MSNPWSQAYEELRKPYLEGKMAKKDYDGDGKIESGTDEYMGSRDKAIKKAMGKKITKEHHQKDANGNVIEHDENPRPEEEIADDLAPSSVEDINELSNKTLGGYIKKASKETRGNMVATQHGSGIPKKAKDIKLKQVNKRLKGMEKAGEKMAKEEVVDEGTLGTLHVADMKGNTPAWQNRMGVNKKGKRLYDFGQDLIQKMSYEPEGDVIDEKKKELPTTKMYRKAGNLSRDALSKGCLLYTSPSPRDEKVSRMPSSA